MLRMTLGHELRALNARSESGLWMRRTTLVRELRTLNAMNDPGS